MAKKRGIVDNALANFDTLMFGISEKELTRRVKLSVVNRMPKGPVGGPPLSDNMLTYRTGRFAKSLEVFYSRKLKAILYFYNPIYTVHETGSRDPRDLIESSIRRVIAKAVGQQFNIFKGF